MVKNGDTWLKGAARIARTQAPSGFSDVLKRIHYRKLFQPLMQGNGLCSRRPHRESPQTAR